MAARCSGASTGIAAMVVQFGLAMMPFGGRSASSGLTSATTSGTCGSIRQAEELSTTIAPAAATFGAVASDAVLPLENSARSRPVKSAASVSSTVISVSAHGSVLPADRADAKYRTSVTGKPRSASTARITPPTCPVAPKTPTRMRPTLRPRCEPFFPFPACRPRAFGPSGPLAVSNVYVRSWHCAHEVTWAQ